MGRVPPPFAVCPRHRFSPSRTPEDSGFSRRSCLSDGLGQPVKSSQPNDHNQAVKLNCSRQAG